MLVTKRQVLRLFAEPRTTLNIVQWIVRPSRHPAPGVYKRYRLRQLARQHGLPILVETGTLYGDTLLALKDNFSKLISIELDAGLAMRARNRLRGAGHVSIIEGDSGVVLPRVLDSIDAPTLFWLDGHYSGEGTALGSQVTPVFEELRCILSAAISCVVVIDDARLFTGRDGYPIYGDLLHHIRSLRPDASIRRSRDLVEVVLLKHWEPIHLAA